ncbi:glycosyltransferase family 2 protein [Martensiomyces pterosporus]|nr:glycosyltransferase family 2 protein [Martensiomyces pterosporus]
MGARQYDRYQERRKRHLKQVELTSGNLVLDCPVPRRVIEMGKYREGNEFTHMRYTAVTSDPNEFMNSKYTLRPVLYGRETELFIVMTMYNEDEILFNRTFTAVMKNIAHLCSRTNSRTWGADAWKKVVVCIVSDGRNKINERVLAVLGATGIYQEGVMQNSVNSKPVTAHLFEYTAQVCMDAKMNFRGPSKGMPPVQVLFCLKEKNAKKINSHRWFFNAFSPLINPNVCVLIDVGTKPTGTSIYHLWKSFDHDPKVAGACGEIAADLGKGCSGVLFNPLVAAQNFEYKISNILDKPLESVFGYISVLPGAFSAYRYSALQDTAPGVGPLAAYFKGELMHSEGSDGGIFEANMYLAEDRILCFELVAKRRCNYVLRYVKSAKAVTDVPDTLSELISQRRRWLNGSFFAAFYAIVHWWRMIGTSHSLYRRLLLTIEFLYQTINMIFSWFALANFYLAYFFLEQNVKSIHDSRKNNGKNPISLNADPFHGGGYYVMEVFRELYILALIMQFVLSLGNRPQGTKAIYRLTVALFTIIMIIITYVALYSVAYTIWHTKFNEGIKTLIHQEKFRDIVISMASTYGIYFVASFLYFEPWHMFTSFLQYTLWLPSSINILMVYAFCNTHDVSWGTKGDTGVSSDLGHAKIEKKNGVEVAHINVATDENDVNKNYDEFITTLKTPVVKTKEKRDAKTKREDQNKIFRTTLVLAWMSTNAVLAMIFSGQWYVEKTQVLDNSGSFNPYLTVIFWSVAGLSAFRFIGSMWYLIRHVILGD